MFGQIQHIKISSVFIVMDLSFFVFFMPGYDLAHLCSQITCSVRWYLRTMNLWKWNVHSHDIDHYYINTRPQDHAKHAWAINGAHKLCPFYTSICSTDPHVNYASYTQHLNAKDTYQKMEKSPISHGIKSKSPGDKDDDNNYDEEQKNVHCQDETNATSEVATMILSYVKKLKPNTRKTLSHILKFQQHSKRRKWITAFDSRKSCRLYNT